MRPRRVWIDRYHAADGTRRKRGRSLRGGGGEIPCNGGKRSLELTVLEAGHGLLDNLAGLLIDGCTGYRGLGKPSSNRRAKSRASSLCNTNEIGSKRSIGSCKISRHRLGGANIRTRSDQTLGVSAELTYSQVGGGRFQASGPSLACRNGEPCRNIEHIEHVSGTHGDAQLFVSDRKLFDFNLHETVERINHHPSVRLLHLKKLRFLIIY